MVGKAVKDGMDIAKFVANLESNLAIMGCPRRRWKRVLLQKLHSESALEALSTLNKEVSTYDEINERLFPQTPVRSLSISVVLLVRWNCCVKLEKKLSCFWYVLPFGLRCLILRGKRWTRGRLSL